MRRSGFVILVVASVGLLAAGARAHDVPEPDAEAAQEPGAGAGPHAWHQSMARELGLSEEQQEKVRELMEAQRPEREALHAKISANRDALERLLESGSADANAVGELVLEGRRLHEEGRALRDAGQKAIRAMLTPEQQAKLDALQKRQRERGRRPGSGFGPPGEGPDGWGGSQGRRGPSAPSTGMPRPPQGPPKPGSTTPVQPQP